MNQGYIQSQFICLPRRSRTEDDCVNEVAASRSFLRRHQQHWNVKSVDDANVVRENLHPAASVPDDPELRKRHRRRGIAADARAVLVTSTAITRDAREPAPKVSGAESPAPHAARPLPWHGEQLPLFRRELETRGVRRSRARRG